MAHEKAAPGDRVEMTFRVRLRRPVAEALTAWAVREEKNLVTLVVEILEGAVPKGMSLVAVLERTGLAAALLGVLCGMRGCWPETVGCGALVLVCTVLAAVGSSRQRTRGA